MCSRRTAAGNDLHTLAARRLHIGGVLAEQVGVVLGPHVAAATPGLVADAEEVHVPGLVTAVLAPLVGQRRNGARGHVLHPVGHLLRAARAHVATDVDLGADHLGEGHELVCAEFIGFGDATPVGVYFHRAFFTGADAVTPVVFVREASARPAHHRHLERFQCGNDVVAVAMGVGNAGFLADPDSFIDAGAEMLGELAIDVGIDDRPWLIGANLHRHFDAALRMRASTQCSKRCAHHPRDQPMNPTRH